LWASNDLYQTFGIYGLFNELLVIIFWKEKEEWIGGMSQKDNITQEEQKKGSGYDICH
jgi:hypothetical protein